MMGPDAFDPAKAAAAARPGGGAGHSTAQAEFLAAIERYRTANHRPFPTWSEVLEVASGLGYRKSGPLMARAVVADRDEVRGASLSAALAGCGVEVTTVASVAGVLAALDPAPQLLVLALAVSSSEAETLARAIRTQQPLPRVAVVCGHGDRKQWERLLGFAPLSVLAATSRIDDVLHVCGFPAVR